MVGVVIQSARRDKVGGGVLGHVLARNVWNTYVGNPYERSPSGIKTICDLTEGKWKLWTKQTVGFERGGEKKELAKTKKSRDIQGVLWVAAIIP